VDEKRQTLRICLNLLAAIAGGQLTRARAFLDRFHQHAPSDELIVIKEQAALVDYTTVPGRFVIDVPIGLGRLKPIRRTLWENLALPKITRKHGTNIYLTFSHYLPQKIDRLIPSVVGVSNLAPFSPEAWNAESWPMRVKMAALRRSILDSARRATRVLALSESCRDVLVERGIPDDKISVTPNGVDPNWGQVIPTSGLTRQSGIVRPYVLYVSHFHRYKNHARLLHAYARLPGDIRNAHQLILVGKPENQSCYEEVRNLIRQLGLSDDAIVLPGLSGDRLREIYQGAALFVFPSLIENSPNILLEAMMACAPVAASSLPPMPEFGGSAAEYFDALDTESISRSIESLLRNPVQRAEMRERSRARALKYSWDKFVANVVDICQRASN
jgi:glycosyltransferase involved in cell wall biosynthesis